MDGALFFRIAERQRRRSFRTFSALVVGWLSAAGAPASSADPYSAFSGRSGAAEAAAGLPAKSGDRPLWTPWLWQPSAPDGERTAGRPDGQDAAVVEGRQRLTQVQTQGQTRAQGQPRSATPLIEARDLLVLSDADIAAGRTEQAYLRLEQIIEHFPREPEAIIAKDRLVAYFRTARRAGVKQLAAPNAGQSADAQNSGAARLRPVDSAAIAAAAPRPVAPAVPRPVTGPVGVDGPNVSARPAPRRGGDDFKQAIGDRVFFDASSARLDRQQRAVLVSQATWLKERPDTMVKIEGHADEPGSADVNMMVAQERAEAVRAVLLKEGVAAERVQVVVAGNAHPVARCDGLDVAAAQSCAGQNRRVITIVEWQEPGPRRRVSVGPMGLGAVDVGGNQSAPTAPPTPPVKR